MPTSSNCLPGYVLEEEITRTERAIIYRAVDEADGCLVAAKLVQNDVHGKHEIEMLQRVQQANPAGPAHVMRLLDTHEDGDDLWMVLELFNATVSKFDPWKITPLALMSIAADSAKGLVEMARAGVVDDDVKPQNIAIKARSGRVVHIDLGCARRSGQKPRGYTPDYVAPEIEQGIPSDTSPCYGWGRTMEFLAIGKIGLGPNYLLSSYVPWMGREFARLVAQCCEPDPDRRPSIEELYRLVKEIVRERRRCPKCNAIRFANGACPTCGNSS